MGEIEAADVLDRMANPHPRMWAEAKEAYGQRNRSRDNQAFWAGYLAAMCAATGYEPSYFHDKLAGEVG